MKKSQNIKNSKNFFKKNQKKKTRVPPETAIFFKRNVTRNRATIEAKKKFLSTKVKK